MDASTNGQRLDYLPGQYARQQIPVTEATRAYSFANQSNAGNQLQFLIRLLPDGAKSNYIRERCQVGDEIIFEAPLGCMSRNSLKVAFKPLPNALADTLIVLAKQKRHSLLHYSQLSFANLRW